jgi:GGDEF domain-containing protein
MISIRRLLSDESQETLEAYKRMSMTLLEAIGLHAVESSSADSDSLRAAIGDLQKSLAGDGSPSNILVTTGAAVKIMQDYNRRTSHLVSAKSSELQSIVGMLTAAIPRISSAGQTSVARLQELQHQVEQAVMLEDVRALKLRVSECLEAMREETERQANESAKVVTGLKQGLAAVQSKQVPEASGGIDPLTGLHSRTEGEQAILEAGGPGSHAYVGLFVLSRLQAVNSRYGPELGDRLLMFLLERLVLGLSAKDQFFRWSTNSFLAVMHRKASAELLRREVGRLLADRLEQTFEIASRTVTVPISPIWTIVPLFELSHGEVIRKLDAFKVAGHA